MRPFLPAALLTLALAQPALADDGVTYQKRTVALVQPAGDPYAPELQRALAGWGRFDLLDVDAGRETASAAIVAKVAARAGTGAATYAFVPRFAFGQTEATSPEPARDSHGKIAFSGPDQTVTVSSQLRCPFSCHVDIYEVPSGKLVHGLDLEESLTRTIEYRYDRHDSTSAIQYKATELGIRLGVELVRSPRDAFASQAASAAQRLGSQLVANVRNLEEFKLQAAILALEPSRDWALFNLGTGLAVRADDWYRVSRDGKDIGFLKIRAMDAQRSAAQPVLLDTELRLGDRVHELPKANAWHGFKAGTSVLNTGPVATWGYGMQWDVGPAFQLSELYLTLDAGGITGPTGGGFDVDLGLVQKYFNRRWGFSWGARGGILGYSPLTQNAVVPAGQLVAGVDCFLTPWLVWNTEAGAQAVWPVATATGGTRFPFGPTLRTGLAFVF